MEEIEIRILIYTDPFLPPTLIKSCLDERTKDVKDLEFRLVEMKAFRMPKEKLTEIHEYWGDPQGIIENLEGVNILVVHAAPVTTSVIEAGKDLKVIACCRGGPVNVNVEAATKRGIPVLHTPGRNADAVADLTIGLIIAEARHIARAHCAVKAGQWRLFPPERSTELLEKTIGIIGFGNVGRKVAERAKGGFKMNVLVYDPYVSKDEIEEFGGKAVDFETLLKESDFVTLHVRLPEEVKGFIGAKELALMKEMAYLINTSRGNAVDYEAVCEALKNRKIAGAAFDVYDKEPIGSDNPLLKLDNVTFTPHIGGMTKEIPLRSAQIVAEDLERFIKGQRPRNVMNPSVFKD